MGISLAKGGNVNLTQGNAGLRQVSIGLGWDARATDGADFDLAAFAHVARWNADEERIEMWLRAGAPQRAR